MNISAGVLRFWEADDHLHMGIPTTDIITGCPLLLTQKIHIPYTVERLFCTAQYLLDHELRDTLTIDGERPFDPHALGVTGEQKDWFVEAQSALRGY